MTAVATDVGQRLAAKGRQIEATEVELSRLREQLSEARRAGTGSKGLREQIAEAEEQVNALSAQRGDLEREAAAAEKTSGDVDVLAEVAQLYERDAAFLRARLDVLRCERELAAAQARMVNPRSEISTVQLEALDRRLAAVDPALSLAQVGGFRGDGGQEFDVKQAQQAVANRAARAQQARTVEAAAERRLVAVQQAVNQEITEAALTARSDAQDEVRQRKERELAPRVDEAQAELERAREAAARFDGVPDRAPAQLPEGDDLTAAVTAMVAAEAERFGGLAAELRDKAGRLDA